MAADSKTNNAISFFIAIDLINTDFHNNSAKVYKNKFTKKSCLVQVGSSWFKFEKKFLPGIFRQEDIKT